jgi:Protein of unknown function (DUF2510)
VLLYAWQQSRGTVGCKSSRPGSVPGATLALGTGVTIWARWRGIRNEVVHARPSWPTLCPSLPRIDCVPAATACSTAQVMSGPNSAAAGWYPDPSDTQRVRYWDGASWSGASHPASPSAATQAFRQSLASTRAPRPWWQTWFAIVPGLLLCLPVGLVGLWLRKGTRTLVKAGVTAGTVLLLGVPFQAPADPGPYALHDPRCNAWPGVYDFRVSRCSP